MGTPNDKPAADPEMLDVKGTDDEVDMAIVAAQAKEVEETMTLREAAWRYKKAMFWSVIVSMVRKQKRWLADGKNIVMESYGTILLNSFYAYDSFKARFGDRLPNGDYSIAPRWQTALCE